MVEMNTPTFVANAGNAVVSQNTNLPWWINSVYLLLLVIHDPDADADIVAALLLYKISFGNTHHFPDYHPARHLHKLVHVAVVVW